MPRILVVDDDKGIIELLSMALVEAGFEVDTAEDGAKGWARFSEQRPDLVVLDVLMPELDGLEVCRRIRAVAPTPVVMLTSRNQEIDVLLGLDVGADDYVTKPFSVRELVARLKAALRRPVLERASPSPVVRHRELEIDRAQHKVRFRGSDIAVTATELELLWVLASEPGRAFSRDELIDAVYGADVVVTDRTIDTFVKRLRAKIRAVGEDYDDIETVRSVGYRYREA